MAIQIWVNIGSGYGLLLTGPSHYLNQCWLFFISEILRHSHENNSVVSADATIMFNELENHTFKLTATYPSGQWVKWWQQIGESALKPTRNCRSVIYSDTPAQQRRGSSGQFVDRNWTSFKTLGFYLPIHKGNVLMKFGFDVQSQTEVRVWKLKNPIWPSGGHFESDISENQ